MTLSIILYSENNTFQKLDLFWKVKRGGGTCSSSSDRKSYSWSLDNQPLVYPWHGYLPDQYSTHKSILNSSDNSIIYLGLLGFCTLFIVLYSKNSTFQELDLLLSWDEWVRKQSCTWVWLKEPASVILTSAPHALISLIIMDCWTKLWNMLCAESSCTFLVQFGTLHWLIPYFIYTPTILSPD